MIDRKPSSFFLSLEGIDGAGKSSHLDAICKYFESLGYTVLTTREPGGTVIAESLRQIVLNEKMDALTEALLVFAARRDHLTRVILPALARGEVVVCDRFTDSTFAYQGFGRQFSIQVLEQLELWVHGDLQPDLTLWFDLTPELAAARLLDAKVPDRFESEQVDFFTRVRAGYAARLETFPARVLRINAKGEKHEIWERIYTALRGLEDSHIARGPCF